MIDLNGEDYVTLLIEAGRIEEGTIVRKPGGECEYVLSYHEPSRELLRTDYNRFGRDCDFVYLEHSNGIYYHYPRHMLLKVKVYKYDLQKEIDDTSEY